MPAAFSEEQLRQVSASADPRLTQAAKAAEDGQVIQFLAGAPELMARYHNAPPAAAALIDAAIDARRMGMGIALPLTFLEAAAPGYVTDTDWDGLGEDWLVQALAYTAVPCKGIRGPLARIRPRPGAERDRDRGPAYRLADYLDQYGRRARRARIPPGSFWDAAARFSAPAALPALVEAAQARGLLRDAARLRKHITAQGNTWDAVRLVQSWYSMQARTADFRPAKWAADHAPLDDPRDVAQLLDTLREAGADEQLADLAARASAHTALHNPAGVARLLDALREAGADEQAADLVARNPAAHAALDWPPGVARLLDVLREAGADEQVAVLATRAAAHSALDDPYDVVDLLDALREAGAGEQVAVLAARAALDDPHGVAGLLRALRQAGADEQVADLAARAAAHAALEHPASFARLLKALQRTGADRQVSNLSDLSAQAAAHAALDDAEAVAMLLDALRQAGADEQVADLAARAAEHAALDDPDAVATLLGALRDVGEDQQAGTLVGRLLGQAQFELFRRQPGHEMRYRFGMEPDGSPALAWGWDNLN